MGKKSALDRFNEKWMPGEGDCWEWTAGRFAGGYGRFTFHGDHILAHRFSYQIHVGPIPDGLHIDHLCRNRGCVNPAHLEPVTAWENTRRGFSLSALNATKTHCQRGHEFTPDNTYHKLSKGRPARQCRACVFQDTAARRSRLRAQGLSTKGRAYRYAAYLSK